MINPNIVRALLKDGADKIAENYIDRGPRDYTLGMIEELLHTIVALDNENRIMSSHLDRFGVLEKLDEEAQAMAESGVSDF